MKLLKSLFFSLATALGVYSAFWFIQSNALEKALKLHIEQLNLDDEAGFHIEYASFVKGGYPFEISIALVNPKITVTTSTEKSTIHVDGKMIDHFSLLGHLKSIEYVGKTHLLIPQDGGNSFQFLVEGAMRLESESGSLIPSSALRNLSKLDQILEHIWASIDLDNSSIYLSDLKISDVQKNIPVLDVEKMDVRFVRQQKSDLNQTIRFQVDIDGFDSSLPISYSYQQDGNVTLYDKLAQKFVLALYSKMGKTALRFDLDLDIPTLKEWYNIANHDIFEYSILPFPPISIAFKGSNHLHSFGTSESSALLLTKHAEPNQDSALIKLDTKTICTKAYVDGLIYALQETVKEAALLKPSNKEEKMVKTFFVKHQEDLLPLIPRLNEFGPIQYALDFNLEIDKEKAHAKAELGKLAFLTELYGLQLHGEGQGGLGSQTGSLTFDLLEYEPLIKDLFAYTNKIMKVVKEPIEFPTTVIDSTLKYLREISDQPESDAKDLHITVSYKEGNMMVGTLDFNDFVIKTAELDELITKELAVNKEFT